MWFISRLKYLLNGLLTLTVICLSPIQAENLTPKQLVGWKQELVEFEKTLPSAQFISERIFINAYIADTPAKRTQGLMHVTDLHENEGMLFIFNRPRHVSMWMKNTLISLDILFIKLDGTIAHVQDNTQPLSLESVTSHHKVKWVLELNAGVAGKLNLKLGDKLVRGKTD